MLYVLEKINNGNMSLVAGEVISCKVSDVNNGRVANVKIKGDVWDKETKTKKEETLDIAFWNSDDGTSLLADRVEKAKISEGSFITALVLNGNANVARGLNFKYSGIWKFPAKDGFKEQNVLVGTVATLSEDKDKRFTRVSVPVTKTNNETEWHNITFWNNENNSNLGERAAKLLGPKADGKKARAVIVCGEDKPYNGSPSYHGFRFDVI